ncbi:hypothetical protein GLYMA_17G208500v4 [Glycine max]|nr:hypothetical protein GLYMA_17G208500v4 [Glycine max]
MMDSPEPSKNNNGSSSSASTLNNNNNNDDAPSSESPQVQESPFLRFVKTLSPIPTKASHMTQGCVGLSSPPLVFKSPRISHRETQLTKRPQGTQSFGGVIPQSVNEGNRLGEAPGDSRTSNSHQSLPERFINDTQQVFDFKNDENTQYYSSPSCIDKYLVDPGDIDQMYSADQDVQQQSTDAAETSLSDQTHSKNNILNFDRKDGPGDKVEESLPLSEDFNKVHLEKAAYGEEPEKMEGEKNDVEWSSQEPAKLESILAADGFDKRYSHGPLPQDVKGCEDYNEMVPTSHVTAENILQDGSEATLKHHGIRRRCLQFGEAASNALGRNVKLNAASNTMITVKPSELVTSLCPRRGSGNFPSTSPKPSGIGLHLNSIINAIPIDQAATTGVRLSDSSQGMKSTSSIRLQRMENVKRSILSSNVDGRSLVDTRTESHEIDDTVATDTGNSEDLNQPPSPCKKKKKTSVTADDNGCKRCNCKKSKCLKLYCDCFAAGTYCTDPCACQGCLNRPEYVETVVETKQQIESRNPIAFAPKIVQPTTDISSHMDDENLTTPSSARHKRGCNCKRSMCLKKYCECYQANVGCSSGCRCEGCKNVHGKKEDYVAFGHTSSKERVSSIVEEGSDCTFHNKLEMVASKTVYDLHCLSPITPSLQCSDEALLDTNEMLGNTPYDSQIECSDAALLQLTPLPNPEQSGTSSFSSVPNECAKITHSRLSHGCIRQLPGGSLRWRSSPLTPSTRVGEAQYLQCSESDSKLFDILENETPDILKEASTPMTSVKVNSPTQKRVSPPQSCHIGIGSSSSGGLRSGRKFILKAVPTFPSLSPCINSKSNGDEDSCNSPSKSPLKANECPQRES